MSTKSIIDCIGDVCPVPVIKVKKVLNSKSTGDYEIRLDNEISMQNVCKFIEDRGYEFARTKKGEHFVINLKASECPRPTKPEISKGSWLVALGSDSMGSDEELGRELLKAYVFSLTQLENLPRCIVLYNRAALLAADSPVLADLINLEKNGVRIIVCGICVQHYELESRLEVGEISNMYAISELMAAVEKVIRP